MTAGAPGAGWMEDGDGDWPEAGLHALRRQLEAGDSAAMAIIQSGRLVFAYGDLARPYLCHSIRKSILAALMGADVEAGRIPLDATLEALGVDDRDGLSPLERQATVYDLLTARSGVYHPAGYETEWMRQIKPSRHSHAPATWWCYNNWDFNALGTIFERLTGTNVAEAFDSRIARPTGMEDFAPDSDPPGAWTEHFTESRHPAYPFRLSTRDLARFGQLCLQGGRWMDTQLLPEGWTDECVRPYSDAGPRGAYGYMWWRERAGILFPRVAMPQGSYAAFGAGGHYCVVVPPLDLVVVHRVDTEIPGREVSWHGFGALMRATLAACPS